MFINGLSVLNVAEQETQLTLRVSATSLEEAKSVVGDEITLVDGVGNPVFIFNGFTKLHSIKLYPESPVYELCILKEETKGVIDQIRADLDYIALMSGVELP